ncbi:hypothetical protein [Hyphococcus sp.]|uniref:hypothetical protein n=1 Tax=Hyphococcus sp. TaxID=2038636 RepID=UPI003CCBB42C
MKILSSVSLASLMFVAQACSPAAGPGRGDAPPPGNPEMGGDGDATTCPLIGSRNWKAWVNAMPGPDARPTLIVEGDVDAPTAGYTFSWQEGVADRSAVPFQRLHLTANPPDGMAAQVITTQTVRYEGPAIAENYRAVAVMCGEELLADITDVMVTR